MAAIWKHSLFQVHQVLVNQGFAKDLARKNNIINGKSINSIYTAPTAKDGKHTYDFLIDSEYKAQDVTIFDDIGCNIIWIPGVLKRIWQGQHHKDFFSRYTNKAWVSHYAIITKIQD